AITSLDHDVHARRLLSKLSSRGIEPGGGSLVAGAAGIAKDESVKRTVENHPVVHGLFFYSGWLVGRRHFQPVLAAILRLVKRLWITCGKPMHLVQEIQGFDGFELVDLGPGSARFLSAPDAVVGGHPAECFIQEEESCGPLLQFDQRPMPARIAG